MSHHTKDKGDLALTRTIYELTKKNYNIFLPVNEHLPIDLIASKDNKFYRIQCKYSVDGSLKNKSYWKTNSGPRKKYYNDNDFDYYALYLPDKDIICYPSIKFAGCKITTTVPNSAQPFWWYEDFFDFTDNADRKTYLDFGGKITFFNKGKERYGSRKVIRPSKEDFTKLVWQFPMTELAKHFGVSDKSISKWIKNYNIEKPPIGYWINKY